MLPFASRPSGTTLSESAWRQPSEIPSQTQSRMKNAVKPGETMQRAGSVSLKGLAVSHVWVLKAQDVLGHRSRNQFPGPDCLAGHD